MKQEQMHLFKEGNSNSKFFHSLIRGRRKLFIKKIHCKEGEWLQGDDNIAKAICDYFQQIFMGEDEVIDETPLECIQRMVNEEQDKNLSVMTSMDELKEVVLFMNPTSVVGLMA